MAHGLPPANRAPFSTAEVIAATDGRRVSGPAETRGVGVATDTRLVTPGAWFVALRGERFDGHRFASDAAVRGAVGIIASAAVEVPDGVTVIEVADTRRALAALAGLHRKRWRGVLLAVGGSAGKTTTRRAVSAVLAEAAPDAVWSTRGNYNNDVGVPLTLLGLADEHRYAVVEIGTNHRGEVRELAAIAAPDCALVTLIGAEHTEGLGSIEEVAAEEGDLFAAVGEGGVVLGLADDERVVAQAARSTARRIFYGLAPTAQVRIVERRLDGESGSILTIARQGEAPFEQKTPLLGAPGALATAAAIAAAEHMLGRPTVPAAVEAALSEVRTAADGRLTLRHTPDGVLWLDDSYNANPPSMLAGLMTAREIADARQAPLRLVLGEMRELGALARSEHERIGAALPALAAAQIVAVSGDATHYLTALGHAERAAFVPDAAAAAEALRGELRAGDVVLLKGSRGIRLERVLERLYPSQFEEHRE